MTTLLIPSSSRPPIQIRKHVRNGAHPDAELMALLAESANHAARWMSQEVCSFGMPLDSIYAAESAVRWRAAWHSSPFAKHLYVRFACVRQGKIGFSHSADPYVKLTVTDATEATTYGTAEFHFGYSSSGDNDDVPSGWGHVGLVLKSSGTNATIPADTDLFLKIENTNDCRVISAMVWEISMGPDTANGYAAQNYAAFSPVMADDRGDVASVARDMWKHGAAKLWMQSHPGTAYLSTTYRNIIDRSSTTVSAATPGATLDLRNRTSKRLEASGVPVKMWVYGTATGASGAVGIHDSTGALIAEILVPVGSAWSSATFYLPATVAKYDLLEKAGAGSITTDAVSLIQYIA